MEEFSQLISTPYPVQVIHIHYNCIPIIKIFTLYKPVFCSFIILIKQWLAFHFMVWGFIQDTIFKSSSQDTQNFIIYKPVNKNVSMYSYHLIQTQLRSLFNIQKIGRCLQLVKQRRRLNGVYHTSLITEMWKKSVYNKITCSK